MRFRIVVLAIVGCLPALAPGQEVRRPFASGKTRQEVISEGTRLEGELEAKYREVRRELVAKRWERAPDKYEDMRRELVARRKERELEKQRRESSDESAGRPSGRVYRGASRVGDNLGTR